MAVSLQEYKNALSKLKNALDQEKNEYIRDSVIQRFEFTVELAWKVSKKVMGTTTTAPKQVVREMAQNNLIDSVELWLEAIDQRNLSAHTYNEELAEKVYSFVIQFLPYAQKLLIELEKTED